MTANHVLFKLLTLGWKYEKLRMANGKCTRSFASKVGTASCWNLKVSSHYVMKSCRFTQLPRPHKPTTTWTAKATRALSWSRSWRNQRWRRKWKNPTTKISNTSQTRWRRPSGRPAMLENGFLIRSNSERGTRKGVAWFRGVQHWKKLGETIGSYKKCKLCTAQENNEIEYILSLNLTFIQAFNCGNLRTAKPWAYYSICKKFPFFKYYFIDNELIIFKCIGNRLRFQ